jgi:hypothetical protein
VNCTDFLGNASCAEFCDACNCAMPLVLLHVRWSQCTGPPV